MPIFEFTCEKCGHPFEELVLRASAIDEVKCPKCGSGFVRKEISLFSSAKTGGSSSPTSTASCTTST
jgi:putative FmdB family regulatory protein